MYWKWQWNKMFPYRLNWARITPWGWWEEWDDTALQTQDSEFEPWRYDAELATSRWLRLPTILHIYEWARKKYLFSFKFANQRGVRTRDLRFFKQSFNHFIGAPALEVTDFFYFRHIICDKLALKSYISCEKPIYFIVSAVRNQSISFQAEWLIVPDIMSGSHIHRNFMVLLKVASGSINSKCIITKNRTASLCWFNVAAAGIRLTLLIFSRQRHNAFSTLTRKDYIVCGAYLAYLQGLK